MNQLTVTGYEVTIAPGALESIRESAQRVVRAHRYAVITDGNVGPLYGARIRALLPSGRGELITLPAGEQLKTRERWAQLTDQLLALGFGRDSALIALGGGVVGDLAGFVAATYLRGIPYIQIPTTLLAMVDASVGGKTGVDTPAGKNLVGAFHRPAAVIIDPDVLATLPRSQLAAGFAEVIKHGVISDADYFDRTAADAAAMLERSDPAMLARMILRSVEIKAGVVQRDEREVGERMVLNFGHTIGHAIEASSRYSLLHGEAVAIGMAVETRCGEILAVTETGTAERIGEALRRFELPAAKPADLDADSIVALTAMDKKARRGEVLYALPTRIGAMATSADGWGVPIPEQTVRAALG